MCTLFKVGGVITIFNIPCELAFLIHLFVYNYYCNSLCQKLQMYTFFKGGRGGGGTGGGGVITIFNIPGDLPFLIYPLVYFIPILYSPPEVARGEYFHEGGIFYVR